MNVGRGWAISPAGPLHGDIKVAGSKNVVTKLLVAALLGDSPSWIHNAPQIGDVEITAGILQAVGAGLAVEGDSIAVDPTEVQNSRVPVQYSGLNRIPILLLGPLLSKLGEAFVPLVGGDALGSRPIDFHLEGIRQLGAEVFVSDEGVEAKARRLHGARIRLPFPSVGATESILLAAATAEGRTVLENAATEPEVVELALFLQRMGAGIELQPDRRFVIEGKATLSGARQQIGGDRIEAFSYLIAGLVTGGRVRVSGCGQDRLVTAISTLRRMGAVIEIEDDGITVSPSELRPSAIHTSPHPGFMTDWQPALAVLFTQVPGMSLIHETVFEDRLGYVDALREMGAELELYDQCLGGATCRFHEGEWLHSVVIRGRSALIGAEIVMPDIRAAFAYVLAAAAASSPSILFGVEQLERGYDQVVSKFRSLGLQIDELS